MIVAASASEHTWDCGDERTSALGVVVLEERDAGIEE
jgi:hypothetical protein